jgi:YVTN family beta-propeller protein
VVRRDRSAKFLHGRSLTCRRFVAANCWSGHFDAGDGRTLPFPIAITPDGKTAYVVSWQAGTVTPIATTTNKPGRPIHVGQGAFTIAITR